MNTPTKVYSRKNQETNVTYSNGGTENTVYR